MRAAVSSASSSAFSDERASPPERAARNSITSSETDAPDLVQRPPQQPGDVLRRQLLQLVDLRARDQRRVDLEVRVLGRRAHEHDEPLLDGGQQRVLLGLVEAVDLVQEEDRVAAGAAALARARHHLAHLGAPGLDRGELLEGGVGVLGEHPRQRRLAGPGRPVEDHRVRLAGLDRGPQRRRGPSRCVWPTNSSSVRGRMRAASGRSAAGAAGRAGGSSGTSKSRPIA